MREVKGREGITRKVSGKASPAAFIEAIKAAATWGARLNTSSVVSPTTIRLGRSGLVAI
jgi:hypothetical protein